jgi:stage IV sporulation protein B
LAILSGLYVLPGVRHLGSLPAGITVGTGGVDRLGSALPPGLWARWRPAVGLVVDGHPQGQAGTALQGGSLYLTARRGGRYDLWLGPWGLPLRHVAVRAVAMPRVVVGGQAIGIHARTPGLLVVQPASSRWPWGWPVGAGLRPGDRIVAVDGVPVREAQGLRLAVQVAGQQGVGLRLKVVRAGRVLTVKARPRRDPQSGTFHLGVQVQDGVSGIGTLTFYDPHTHAFFALGHRIQDGWTHTALPVTGGEVRRAIILGVQPGRLGGPGEKVGMVATQGPTGWVAASGRYGLYGFWADPRGAKDWLRGPLLPLATPDEVHPGPAQVRTVLLGNRVETFGVRIERVDPWAAQGRGLSLRVTDPRLLRQGGGIVQGMSGSPILQDGRLVGAVTHVRVGDSRRGYGVFAAWMWQEAVERLHLPLRQFESNRQISTSDAA